LRRHSATTPIHRSFIRWRIRASRMMSDHPQSVVGKFVHIALVTLIILNVLAVTFESVERWSVVHGPIFQAFDTFSVAVFTVEYLIRLWVAVDLPSPHFRHPFWGRLKWATTPSAIVDLMSIAPFFLGIAFDIDLRVLRVLRIFRVLKLSRYSLALTVIVDVIRQEIRTIGAMLIVLGVVLVISASLIYLAEHHAQPQVYTDIPTCMWWAVVTITTLGYGDMVPVTTLGKFVASATAITGLGMIALPSGFLASGFSEQLRIRREEYRTLVDDVLEESGQISRSQRMTLDEARRDLNLTEDSAVEILHDEITEGHFTCPHCGKSSRTEGSAEAGLDQ